MSDDDPIPAILQKDPRYARAAYDFVRDAMRFLLDRLGERRHVSAAQLLEGVRDLALRDFGPLTRTVLAEWGVHATADFGQIVFNLIAAGEFGKNENDDIADFDEVFDFDEAFPDDTDDARVVAEPDAVWDETEE